MDWSLVQNFMRYPGDRQKNKQTNKQTKVKT